MQFWKHFSFLYKYLLSRDEILIFWYWCWGPGPFFVCDIWNRSPIFLETKCFFLSFLILIIDIEIGPRRTVFSISWCAEPDIRKHRELSYLSMNISIFNILIKFKNNFDFKINLNDVVEVIFRIWRRRLPSLPSSFFAASSLAGTNLLALVFQNYSNYLIFNSNIFKLKIKTNVLQIWNFDPL